MTKWEIGQSLIKLSDDMAEAIDDLNESGHVNIAVELDIIRARVGDIFNRHNDHEFGVFDSGSLVNLIVKSRKD